MEHVFFEGKVLWSQVDANMHLRHSAYADFAAQARLELLEKMGFNSNLFEELKIGPILFREELIYMREVRPNDVVSVTVEMTRGREDGSRWSFSQKLFRSDGIQAAQINVDGAWIDMAKRKLTALPKDMIGRFLSQVPKTPDFVLEPVPVKTPETPKDTSLMTELEQNFEAAKKRVLELPAKPSNEKMLELYALNKQATIGDINVDKPAMFDFVAAAKYNAWKAKTGLGKEEAMQQYIDYVNSLFN